MGPNAILSGENLLAWLAHASLCSFSSAMLRFWHIFWMFTLVYLSASSNRSISSIVKIGGYLSFTVTVFGCGYSNQGQRLPSFLSVKRPENLKVIYSGV